jgi:hypothetical protein
MFPKDWSDLVIVSRGKPRLATRDDDVLTADGELVCRADAPGKPAVTTPITGVRTHVVSFGLRILNRSSLGQDSTSSSNGGAAELLYQYDLNTINGGFSGFLGASGIAMNESSSQVGNITTQFPKFSMARISFGVEGRGAVDPSGLLNSVPRLGAYAVLAKAFWTDPYSGGNPAFDTSIRSNEVEVGAYIAGRLTSGFHGMIAFRLLKPFGDHNDLRYILSIIPSATSEPAKTETANQNVKPDGDKSS